MHSIQYRDSFATDVVLIGSSTGGPSLVVDLCATIPDNFTNAICIVQHLPSNVVQRFVQSIQSKCKLLVKEVTDGELILQNRVYVAKGDKHLTFENTNIGAIRAKLVDNYSKKYFVPSVDEMFLSASKTFKNNSVMGVILTGIGDDGAHGACELVKNGSIVYGQSKDSCPVYGMPKAAKERGGITQELDVLSIAKKIAEFNQKELKSVKY